MPWQHVIVNARCSWLHGDPRGFRDRDHRLHSSGDYKHPPPADEHAAIFRYYRRRAGKAIHFSLALRILILREFVQKLRALEHPVIAAAIAARHLHALTDLPNNYEQMKREIGKCKQKASHAVRTVLPGTIWAAGAEFMRINDRPHLHNTYAYIRKKQEAGAVVWSHKDDENWIDCPEVGIPIMLRRGAITRVFGLPQTPASEVSRRPGF